MRMTGATTKYFFIKKLKENNKKTHILRFTRKFFLTRTVKLAATKTEMNSIDGRDTHQNDGWS